ncbi:Putative transposase (identified by ISEscan HMM) [Klebsiella pneumoniae]|nr:Putative transposase (identified by ISEscan HMM) [Klebsiella pneumoniae]
MTHRNSLFDHEKSPRELSGDILEWFKGSADKFLDLQELIYAFIRGPDSGRRTHYRYGKKASVVVMELGYPSTKQLGRWVRIYEEKAIYRN